MTSLIYILITLIISYSTLITIKFYKNKKLIARQETLIQDLKQELFKLHKQKEDTNSQIKYLLNRYGEDIHHIGILTKHNNLNIQTQSQYLENIGLLIRQTSNINFISNIPKISLSKLNIYKISFFSLLSLTGDLLCNDWKHRILKYQNNNTEK